MGKYTGIIIVSDVDGTFLSRIPEIYKKNVQAIERFKADGGIFTFATGRDFHSLKIVVPDAEDIANAPIIASNGASLYNFREEVYIVDEKLNMPEFMKIAKIIMAKYPEIGIRFSGNDTFMTPDINDIIKEDLTKDKDKKLYEKVREIPLDKINNATKCVIVHAPEILDDVQKICEALDKEQNFYLAKSYDRGLEVVNKTCTKGKTSRKLKEYLEMSDGILYAIGDYYNDHDMLLSADVAVCPQNAVDAIKAAAKIITKSCDEGAIADLIEIITERIL